MADYENQVKQGVSAPLWGDTVFPWQLSLPWQYVNPTPISYGNEAVNSATWANDGKTISGAGLFKGFPFGITEPGSTAIAWANQSKN